MQPQHYLNVDLARVYDAMGKGRKLLTTLAWGDPVEVLEQTRDHIRVSTVAYREDKKDKSFRRVEVEGYIPLKKAGRGLQPVRPLAENPVLKVDFVDVQQGDGCVVEAPNGEIVLIDGGEEQLFARYLANRFHGTTLDKPKVVDCIVVTHGDADHFAGLVKVRESEEHDTVRKHLFIEPRHVYHNGLVKGPSTDSAKRKVKDEKIFGGTKQTPAGLLVTALHDNLLEVPKKAMNGPFLKWQQTLKTWQDRTDEPIDIRRIACGDNGAFDFLTSNNPGLGVEVLGPILTQSNGTTGLKFLGPPSKRRLVNETLDLDDDEPQSKAVSASHTINGHSIVLRMKYKNVRFLFSGDLNEESERELVDGNADLQAEVLKVPHHGSADFSPGFLGKVQPIVSVVSSGDENARKEYIHPRANLMASLGRYSRDVEPVVFVTEMVAFFKTVGYVTAGAKKAARRFFAFERSAFGIVKVRTDGERLLVYTNSGLEKLKEAYVYRVEASGQASPETLRVL